MTLIRVVSSTSKNFFSGQILFMTAQYFAQSIEDKSPAVRLIRLAPVDQDTAIDFLPGQYAKLAAGEFDPKPFSIGGLPGTKSLDFYITRGGDGLRNYFTTDFMIGDRVSVDGPFGTMTVNDDIQGPILAVSGGTGLVPILPILEQGLKNGWSGDVVLYHGVRTEAELYDMERLQALTGMYPNFSFHIRLSDQTDSQTYPSGLLNAALDGDIDDLGKTSVYMAGPPPMISAVLPVLVSKNLTAVNLYTDKENLSPQDLDVLNKVS